jgi:hypothetical protein
MKFLEAITNVFRIPDLRKRLLFALGLLAVYRVGGHIPIPGIDAARFEEFISQNQGTVFGFFDLFSGGTFRRPDTIFAPGHHALHHLVDHPAVADGGGADSRKAPKRRANSAAARSPSGLVI